MRKATASRHRTKSLMAMNEEFAARLSMMRGEVPSACVLQLVTVRTEVISETAVVKCLNRSRMAEQPLLPYEVNRKASIARNRAYMEGISFGPCQLRSPMSLGSLQTWTTTFTRLKSTFSHPG